MKYCSQCRHSEYVDTEAGRRLRCEKFKELGFPALLGTSCTYADGCYAFEPERADYKSRKAWLIECKRCGVDWKA